MRKIDLLELLNKEEIEFQYFEHPVVMTSVEAAKYLKNAPGVSGKNLFLRDKKGRRFFLLITLGEKLVDLKLWAKQEELGKLSFANIEELSKYLQVESGAVGPLALINDTQQRIEVFVDKSLWSCGVVRCHPLVNTASLILTTDSMRRFFDLTGHKYVLVDVPTKKANS